MEITQNLKTFLEYPHIQALLNNKKFNEIYKIWEDDNSNAELTTFLFECGVDPFDYMTKIPDGAFVNCLWLKTYTTPIGVIHIGDTAFGGCTNLNHINISGGVNTIDEWAFCGCTGLTNVIIPEGVKYLYFGCFMNCPNLTSITLPKSLLSIAYTTFKDDTKLTEIEYMGTAQQWKDLLNGDYTEQELCPSLKRLICSDTILEVN